MINHPSKKRILVTGGAGFIGSNLVDYLLKRGDEVLCLDNLSTGTKRNLDHLSNHKSFEFIRHDITFPLSVEVDQIYNLACPASPIKYQFDPVQTIKANVHGSINMLELAKCLGATILQASTSEIYGDPSMHPQKESYWGNVNPIGIRSCYDEGKRCAETLFFDYYRQYKLDIRVARIFNTYGPRLDPFDGRVISNFITQAIKGEDITIYGDGSQTRSFCYVDDLIEGLVRFMDLHQLDTPSTGFAGPINLGNPQEFTVLELAEMVLRLTNSKSKLKLYPLPADDPIRRKPDITRAKEYLNGWEPRIQLEEGIIKTIRYFSETLKQRAQ